MAPSQQKALFLDSRFGKFVLDTTDVPKPGPDDILVKIKAVALNHVDWKIQKYGIFVKSFPAILGSDMAGEVEQLGEGVIGFAVGDRVLSQGAFASNRTMFFQQYAIVKPETLGKLPSNVAFGEMLLLFLWDSPLHTSGCTTVLRPTLRGEPSHPRRLQLCGSIRHPTRQTVWVLINYRNPFPETFVLPPILGATHVLDRNSPPERLTVEISKIAGSVRYVFDAISLPGTQKFGYSLLASGGRLGLVGLDAVENKVAGKSVIMVFGTVDNPENRDMLLILYKNITSLLEERANKPNRVEVLKNGLGGILGGLQQMEKDLMSGVKLVVKPDETL
ncbi:hypothetical protein AMATHDRAFT_4355 [Amanita thiersii Skay4041]|uniref:Cyclic nucleotide-binding domain-containing protein n=1 Tax=Amanita thiersii Skay4041 TaxID=703135 RepID=A0A2A9NL15_9AGAR|nr:hypothetical protein AMATHDRAFT_4355 [Amanita thiersii Skay4041]